MSARRSAAPAARPPKDLPDTATAWWQRMVAAYGITDEGGLILLEMAARAYARGEEARQQLDRDGCTTVDKFGQRKAHPAAAVERDARAGMLAALRQLHLDVEPLIGKR